LKRRNFGATGIAAVFLGHPILAHQELPFEMPVDFLPTVVRISEQFQPGELHVLPDQFRLYWTIPDQKAIRYSVGVGRPGLYHSGTFVVGRKSKWPRWTPTPEMIERDPEAYEQFSEGMPGGVDNPLGARALYLFDQSGRDTYLRIHGTNKPRTIGTRVSNGCARLTNEHITDLYNRVPVGTRVFMYEQDLTRNATL
jgi:lipoprotein-anchoring transpeptidase ErfK/SrfK